MHRCNSIAAAEADPVEGPSARDWMRPCPAGPHPPEEGAGAECPICNGLGAVDDDPRELGEGGEGGAPWMESCGEFLEVWAAIEKYGVEGWSRLMGGGEDPAPDLAEALGVFDAELNRLRHEDDVRRARKARAERK